MTFVSCVKKLLFKHYGPYNKDLCWLSGFILTSLHKIHDPSTAIMQVIQNKLNINLKTNVNIKYIFHISTISYCSFLCEPCHLQVSCGWILVLFWCLSILLILKV